MNGDGGGLVTGIFQLDAGLFESSSTSAAYLIWQNLMVFANAGIVIVLLVVIFSQLTGYGIDNYGIKKMLPKFIIAAILINVSFLLCQLAVDFSNIIGKGIIGIARDIRTNVTGAMGGIGVAGGAEVTFASLFTLVFGGAAAAGAAAGVVTTAIAAGPLWWIPLIFVTLAGLVAFIIFFLLLATRQLLAVILVTVAPLAMLCYILPNTQKIFKKWLDLFKSVLIIYPVCAALYGISVLMKIIAFRAEGIHILMAMVAMLMTFVPLYAAPIMIKKALAGFDMIGGMISGMGQRVKSGIKQADQAFRDSSVYKDAQKEGMRRRAERNVRAYEAVRRARENGTRARRGQRLRSWIAGGERGFARNQAFLEKAQNEDTDTERFAMRQETGNYNNEIMGNQLSQLLDQANNRELTTRERNRVEALSSQLASQAGGARELANATRGRTGRAAQIMGEYIARNNTVNTSLGGKSQRTSSRLSDIAAGVIDANTTQEQYDNMNNAYLQYRRQQVASGQTVPADYGTGFRQWEAEQINAAYRNYRRDEEAAGRTALDAASWRARETANGGNMGVDRTSVIQNIARNVLDKDRDLVTQSGAEVQELLRHVDQNRIDKMASNPNLFGHGDIAEGAEQAVLSRASSTYVDNAGNEVNVRNVRRDDSGAVIGYDINRNDGHGWRNNETGNLDAYTPKAEHTKRQAENEASQARQQRQQQHDDMMAALNEINRGLRQHNNHGGHDMSDIDQNIGGDHQIDEVSE